MTQRYFEWMFRVSCALAVWSAGIGFARATPRICESSLQIFDEAKPLGETINPLLSSFSSHFSTPGMTVVFVATHSPDIVTTFTRSGVHAFFETIDDLVKVGSNTVDGIFLDRSLRRKNPDEVQKILWHCFHLLKPGGRLFISADTPTQKIFSPAYYLAYRNAVDRKDSDPGYFEDIGVHTFDLRSLNHAVLDAGFAVEQVDYSSHPERHSLLRDPGDTGMDGVYAIASKPLSNTTF